MTSSAEALFLTGRVLLGSLFLMSAVGHLANGAAMVTYAREAGVPFPALAAWPAGLVIMAGALSIALGAWPDVGALILGVFVVLAAAYLHRFWTVEDSHQKQVEALNFARNITLLGACLALFAVFATIGHSLDLTITGPLFDLR